MHHKHNEQINNQNINNSECFGVKFVKIYPEIKKIKNVVLVDYIGIFFIPTEDLRPTSFGPNDIDNIDKASKSILDFCPKKQKED